MDTARLRDFTIDQLKQAQALDYCRFLSALHETDGGDLMALKVFQQRWPLSLSIDLVTKALIAPGTTTDGTWASPLVALKPLMNALLALVRPATLLGRIIGLREVPLNIRVASQIAGGVYQWVGEGAPAPITKPGFGVVTLPPAKVSGILVVSKELMTLAQPGSEQLLRAELVGGVTQFLDFEFIDPTVAAVGVVSPASITHAAVAIPSSGPTPANALTDFKALLAAFVGANPNATSAVLLASPTNAIGLAIASNAHTLVAGGGVLFGVTVLTSTALGSNLVMLDPAAVLVHDGDIEIDISTQATLQLDSAPSGDAASIPTSLWQSNLVGLKILKFANWKLARAGAVQVLTGAAYS